MEQNSDTRSEGNQELIVKKNVDRLVLKHMARKIWQSLQTLDHTPAITQPQLIFLSEHKPRTHRLVLYNPQELLTRSELAFVGFISGKQRPLSPPVAEEIQRIDEKLLVELASINGILSYSSLELRNSNWYNLVLLSDLQTRGSLATLATHQYASYQVAPHYYKWIRLHNGVLPGGLSCYDLRFRGTKYYFFSDSPRPDIRELRYEE